MGKKDVKAGDPGQMELALESMVAELASMRRQIKKLSAGQKAAKRELHALKKRVEKAPLCKCAKKKKAGSGKKSKAKSSLSAVTQNVDFAATASLVATPGNGADDLKMISGVGPKLEGTLNELGIFRFEQIAAWDDGEVDRIDDHLNFSGRIQRENWIGQAKALAKGGREEYVKVFGKEPR